VKALSEDNDVSSIVITFKVIYAIWPPYLKVIPD